MAHSAAELRKMLDDLGLKCCGTHTGLNTLLGDALPATVEFNQTLGNKYPDRARPAPRAHRIQSRLARNRPPDERDQRTGQAAGHEDGLPQPPYGVPCRWTANCPGTSSSATPIPDVVMQFDTGNAMHGGAEAGPFLRRYPHRALTVHLKEFSATNDKALIGEGDVKWSEIFESMRNHRRNAVVYRGAGELRLSAAGVRGSLPAKPAQNGQVASADHTSH